MSIKKQYTKPCMRTHNVRLTKMLASSITNGGEYNGQGVDVKEEASTEVTPWNMEW